MACLCVCFPGNSRASRQPAGHLCWQNEPTRCARPGEVQAAVMACLCVCALRGRKSAMPAATLSSCADGNFFPLTVGLKYRFFAEKSPLCCCFKSNCAVMQRKYSSTDKSFIGRLANRLGQKGIRTGDPISPRGELSTPSYPSPYQGPLITLLMVSNTHFRCFCMQIPFFKQKYRHFVPCCHQIVQVAASKRCFEPSRHQIGPKTA